MPINQRLPAMMLLLCGALLGLRFQLNAPQDKGAHDQNQGLRATSRQLQGSAQCSLTYTAVPGLSPGSHVGRLEGLSTMDDCMRECCANDQCEAIVWHPSRSPTRCYLLNRSYESNYRSNSNAFVANKALAFASASQLTPSPSGSPSEMPPRSPTNGPTPAPTESPTSSPSNNPTEVPTSVPTQQPTQTPSNAPTTSPSSTPSEAPTPSPTFDPTMAPSPIPSDSPTFLPTQEPTPTPSSVPSQTPPVAPTTTDEGLAAKEALYSELGLQCDDYSDDAFHTCSCQQGWCNSISPGSTCSATPEGAVCECDTGYLGSRCEQEDAAYVESQKQDLNDGGIFCQNYNTGWFHTCSCEEGYCSAFAVSVNIGPTGCTCSCAETHIGARCESRNRGGPRR